MTIDNKIYIQEGDLGSGKIVVPYKLDDISREFVLDTGASFTHVDFDKYTEKYTGAGEIRKKGAGGSLKTGDSIQIPLIKIGELELRDVTAARFKEACRDNLGNDILEKHVVELKVSQNRITFDKSRADYKRQVSFFKLPTKQIKFFADFAKQKIGVIFDTGAELNSIDSAFVEELHEYFEFIQKVDDGLDITGAKVAMDLYRVKKPLIVNGVALGLETVISFDFAKIREYFGENTPLILGVNSIRKADWLINFPKKVLFFNQI